MIIGVDATNISAGGGVTHLVELFGAACPEKQGFSKVIVWSKRSTLERIAERPWLEKQHISVCEKNIILRMLWQRLFLSKLARKAGCHILFVPGGAFTGNFKPFVTMSQNMLPFEWREMRRYGMSLILIKLLLLRYVQNQTFKKANGLIFLTRYAKKNILKVTGKLKGKNAVIPHGVDMRFFSPPRRQRALNEFRPSSPCRFLYVSHPAHYKHQWHVAEAVAKLKASGLNVKIEFAGPSGDADSRLFKALRQLDSKGDFMSYRGQVPFEDMHKIYANVDIIVYASSCENMPNIVLEGMASGLPIACSSYGPMPEILGEAGMYFNPEQPDDIADVLTTMMHSRKVRQKMAQSAFEKAQKYSWHWTSRETFRLFKSLVLSRES